MTCFPDKAKETKMPIPSTARAVSIIQVLKVTLPFYFLRSVARKLRIVNRYFQVYDESEQVRLDHSKIATDFHAEEFSSV